jgi:hypothetical protein
MNAPTTDRGSPTLTFRGGGWVIALAALLVLLVFAWSMLGPIMGRRPTGDGHNLASYGYDLSTLLVPRESLTPSGNPRGFLPSLDAPAHLRGAEMRVFNENNRPKYVVSTDRVLGIVINGQAHAWPLSMLNVHEVVNDTVAGLPVVATYSPLCDTAMVFKRDVGGAVRVFEVSGLLVDSNLVLCDKSVEKAAGQVGADAGGGSVPTAHVPSLFLQLERRAVAGPLAAAGAGLELLAGACITTWADWLALHPQTTVTLRDPQMIRRMKEISYARYFLSDGLEYPAEPMRPRESLAAEGLRLKSPMIAFELGGVWRAVSVETLASRCDAERSVRWTVDGVPLIAHVPAGPAVARVVREDGQPLHTVPSLLFALDAVLAAREGPTALEVIGPPQRVAE